MQNFNRIIKTEGGQTTLYINRYYEVNLSTSTNTTYYYLAGQLVAMSVNSTLRYVHQDSLTSTSLMTDSSGASLGTIKFYPFGATRSGSVPTDKQFTGQRLDSIGLYYYGARYYDPTIGRFISADTLVQFPANPQSLNRYSYVLNNPLRYIDPSGLGLGGDAETDDETYLIEYNDKGEYRVVGTDGTVSGWYPDKASLEASWGDYQEERGGGGEWVEWQGDKTYDIKVYDKKLYPKGITVHLIPENYRLVKGSSVIGWSDSSGNVYLRWQYYLKNDPGSYLASADYYTKLIRHEWYHEYIRETIPGSDISYSYVQIALSIFYNKPSTMNPYEWGARVYAGEDAISKNDTNPGSPRWFTPQWYTQLIIDHARKFSLH